jgi:phosphoketolase
VDQAGGGGQEAVEGTWRSHQVPLAEARANPALFSCYEAFIHIVDSMFNQHAKWLKTSRQLPWRRPVASLNYLLTSDVWRQDRHPGQAPRLDPGTWRGPARSGRLGLAGTAGADWSGLRACLRTCRR